MTVRHNTKSQYKQRDILKQSQVSNTWTSVLNKMNPVIVCDMEAITSIAIYKPVQTALNSITF
jgi:hypothetical protein